MTMVAYRPNFVMNASAPSLDTLQPSATGPTLGNGCPCDDVGSMSGAHQIAADLWRRPTWQPWATSGPQCGRPTKRWSALPGTLQLPPTPTKAAVPPDGSRIAEPC